MGLQIALDEARIEVKQLRGVIERQQVQIEALRIRVTRAAAGAVGDPSLIEQHLRNQVRDQEIEIRRLTAIIYGSDGDAKAG
jgi:hypothetical protein